MTHDPAASPPRGPNLLRSAIWVAIGALILAAIVCVVWVLIGSDNGIIGRAFLTILLLAGFAGVAILDAHLAQRRPAWFTLTSMLAWVAILLIGAFLIWMPTRGWGFAGFERLVSFLLIVLVIQLAVLHVRLYVRALERHATGFTRTIAIITIVLVAALTVMLVLPLTFHEYAQFEGLYWRIVVAITILAAVGTALLPLINALFAPKAPRPQAPAGYVGVQPGHAPGHPQGAYPGQPAGYAAAPPWPTYADGVTPLPVLPDGSPDWNAYYTGYPTYPQHPAADAHPGYAQTASADPAPAAPAAADTHVPPAPGAPAASEPAGPPAPSGYPAQPGYQGYPPPPPPPQ